MKGNYLEVIIKQVCNANNNGVKTVKFTSKAITEDIDFREDHTLQYQFTNLGTDCIKINDIILYPSSLGALVLHPNRSEWVPPMKLNEFDSTLYRITFHKYFP